MTSVLQSQVQLYCLHETSAVALSSDAEVSRSAPQCLVNLTSRNRTSDAGIQLSHRPQVLSCASATGKNRDSIFSASYRSDRTLQIDYAKLNQNDTQSERWPSTQSRLFPWLRDPTKGVTALCFSDDGTVLVVTTADGGLYLLPVMLLLAFERACPFHPTLTHGDAAAAEDSPDSQEKGAEAADEAQDALLGLPKLRGCAIPIPVGMQLAPTVPAAERPQPPKGKDKQGKKAEVAAKLGRGQPAVVTSNDRPTCITWWTPTSTCIDVLLRRAKLARTSGEHQVDVSDGYDDIEAPFKTCENSFVIIGYASGRLCLVDVSSSARHVVWSALVDPGQPIEELTLFASMADMVATGAWILPSAYTLPAAFRYASDGTRLSGSELTQPADEYELAVWHEYPAPLTLPTTSLIVRSAGRYLRMALEKPVSDDSALAERRAAAHRMKVSAAVISRMLSPKGKGTSKQVDTSTGPKKGQAGAASISSIGHSSDVDGSTLEADELSDKVEAMSEQLPSARWTTTLLDVTGEAAVLLMQQAQRDGESESGVGQAALAGIDASTAAALLQSTTGNGRGGALASEGAALQALASYATNTAVYSRAGVILYVPIPRNSGPTRPALSDRADPVRARKDGVVAEKRAAFAGNRRTSFAASVMGFTLVNQDTVSSVSVADPLRLLPPLPATFSALPQGWRPRPLAQSPTRCDISVHISQRTKSPLIAVFYWSTGDDKLLLFDPTLGEQPLYEMSCPTRGNCFRAALARVAYARLRTKITGQAAMPSTDLRFSALRTEGRSDEDQQRQLRNGSARIVDVQASQKGTGAESERTVQRTQEVIQVSVRYCRILWADGLMFVAENPSPEGEDEDSDGVLNEPGNNGAEGGDASSLSSRTTISEDEGNPEPLLSAVGLPDGPALPLRSTSTAVGSTAGAQSKRAGMSRSRVMVISANLACRAFRDGASIDTAVRLVSSGQLQSNGSDQPTGLLPVADSLLLPAESVMETFELPEGEVVLKLSRSTVAACYLLPSDASPNSLSGSPAVVVHTTFGARLLLPKDICYGQSLLQRLIDRNGIGLPGMEGAAAAAAPSLDRLSFALGLSSTDAFETMADEQVRNAGRLLKEALPLACLDLKLLNGSLSGSRTWAEALSPECAAHSCMPALDALDVGGHALLCAYRAAALYALASPSPLKPIHVLTAAGRPDLAAAYALRLLQTPTAPSLPALQPSDLPDLPIPVSLKSSLSPTDRTRVANFFVQCQLLCPHTSGRHYGLNESSFITWLESNEDYVARTAADRAVSAGAIVPAFTIAARKDGQLCLVKGSLFQRVFSRSIALHGVQCIAGRPPVLRFLAAHGALGLLLTEELQDADALMARVALLADPAVVMDFMMMDGSPSPSVLAHMCSAYWPRFIGLSLDSLCVRLLSMLDEQLLSIQRWATGRAYDACGVVAQALGLEKRASHNLDQSMENAPDGLPASDAWTMAQGSTELYLMCQALSFCAKLSATDATKAWLQALQKQHGRFRSHVLLAALVDRALFEPAALLLEWPYLVASSGQASVLPEAPRARKARLHAVQSALSIRLEALAQRGSDDDAVCVVQHVRRSLTIGCGCATGDLSGARLAMQRDKSGSYVTFGMYLLRTLLAWRATVLKRPREGDAIEQAVLEDVFKDLLGKVLLQPTYGIERGLEAPESEALAWGTMEMLEQAPLPAHTLLCVTLDQLPLE